MIKKFMYENFKSFEKSELTLHQLTTLIGTNASGKSNAIEGIKILSMIVSGLDLSVVLDGSKSVDSGIRGGSQGCKRFRTGSFKLGCRMTCDYDDERDLFYEIRIGVNGRVVVEEEGLYLVGKDESEHRGDKVFKTKQMPKEHTDIKVEYRNGKVGKNPDTWCTRTAAVLPQIVNRIPRDTPEELQYVRHMENAIRALSKIHVYQPNPRVMRDYSRMSDQELSPDCNNISSVLYEVCKDDEKKHDILGFLCRLPENEIQGIDFVKTKIGDVIFALKERYMSGYESVDAKKLSDGTLRSLASILAVISSNPDDVVVIEEIDNGVHPSRVGELMKIICELSKLHKSDIIITTHNASMIDRYEREELAGIVVLFRGKDNGISRMLSIMDVEDLPRLVLGGGLGEAMIDMSLIRAIKEEKPCRDFSWMGVV